MAHLRQRNEPKLRNRSTMPHSAGAIMRGAAGTHAGAGTQLGTVSDDSTAAGRALRLRQEYFLVSASIQDVIARHLAEGRDLPHFGRQLRASERYPPALAPAD